jgi:hypothetical protein
MSTDAQQTLQILEAEHGITGGQVYLLELIPLIEMVWADGRSQKAEMDLVYRAVLDRMAGLSREAHGEAVVTVEEANAFLDRFLHTRPSPELLRRLRELAGPLVFSDADPAANEQRKDTLLELCMDIAAASVHHYPFGARERFMQAEKDLLLDLMRTLNIPPDARAPAP